MPSPTSVPPIRRHFLTGYHVWALLSGVFLLWLLNAPKHTPGNRDFMVLFLTMLDFAAAWAIKRASRRPDLPAAFRRGLVWIALGGVLAGFGSLYVSVDVILHPGNRAFFSLADLLFLSTYAALMVGLFCMPRADRPSVGLGRLLVDSAVFIAGVGLPLWFFAVQPGLSKASGYDAALVVAYPLVTFTGIMALNVVLLTRLPLPSTGAFRLLATAIGVSWLADLLFLLDSVHGFISTGTINWINVFNTLSSALLFLAAGRIATDAQTKSQAVQPASSSPLPMITIFVASSWLLMFVVYGHPEHEALSRIFWSLALLFVILSLREMFVVRDNSRWLAAEFQRESRARFESLVRNSSDVIMVVDGERTIRFASPAVAAALGTPADSIAGKPLLSLAHPEDAAKGAEFLDRLLIARKARRTVRWRLRHSDGNYRHFETVGSNIGDDLVVEGLVINSRDVTDRIALEEQLRQSQRLEALGQLVGGIAHNFNNILTSTMMRLGVLRENHSLPPEVTGHILALDQEARRSADLTKKLVMFGQQQFMQKEPFDLRRSVEMLRAEITGLVGSGIELCVTGGASPEWVWADAALIDQVVLSLCANARDAMPDGGRLTVDIAHVESPLNAAADGAGSQPGSFVRLSIKDTGHGMDGSVRRRLFEPFFTTKGVGKGLGLGLAAVHGIVKQHGGWIDVESAPGLGSTFSIHLPWPQPPQVR